MLSKSAKRYPACFVTATPKKYDGDEPGNPMGVVSAVCRRCGDRIADPDNILRAAVEQMNKQIMPNLQLAENTCTRRAERREGDHGQQG